jgi:uncharacterized protein (DUF885 family)
MKFAWAMTILLTGAIAGPAAADPAASALQKLFTDERAFVWREDPLSATYDGVHDYDDRLPAVTPVNQARRLEADRAFLQRLAAIDRSQLSNFDLVSYDLFEFMVSERVVLAGYREWRTPLNSDSGFYAEILQLHDTHAPRSVHDY